MAKTVDLKKVNLVLTELTNLHVDGDRLMVFDNILKEVVYPITTSTEREFQSVLYAMLVQGMHWGYVSPGACDMLCMDLEMRLQLIPDEQQTPDPRENGQFQDERPNRSRDGWPRKNTFENPRDHS